MAAMMMMMVKEITQPQFAPTSLYLPEMRRLTFVKDCQYIDRTRNPCGLKGHRNVNCYRSKHADPQPNEHYFQYPVSHTGAFDISSSTTATMDFVRGRNFHPSLSIVFHWCFSLILL
ncbi:hypothetical protein AHF37_08537 [Paragonimus kellicotti]|nr:hypothetical protein AHF37_08537 [Paragonimus kellicotti]